MADKKSGAVDVDYVSPNKKEFSNRAQATPNPEPSPGFLRKMGVPGAAIVVALATVGLIDDKPTDHDMAIFTDIENSSGQVLALGVDNNKDVESYFVDPESLEQCTADQNCVDINKILENGVNIGYPVLEVVNNAHDAFHENTVIAAENFNAANGDKSAIPHDASDLRDAQNVIDTFTLMDSLNKFAIDHQQDLGPQVATDFSNLLENADVHKSPAAQLDMH